jgi:hypothetical protein
MFWTDKNEMSQNRIRCMQQFKNVSETNVILITPDNLSSFVMSEAPLHPAYEYLSATHKADYLRTYFMHFYGGGYSDIKMTTGSWRHAFKELYQSNNYINGYSEMGPHCIAGTRELRDKWQLLIGNCAYICEPQTEFTEKWYGRMIKLMDEKISKLREYPATFPQDCAEISNGKYPIEWNEMLGRIFHPICYEYHAKVMNTLPTSIFQNYR